MIRTVAVLVVLLLLTFNLSFARVTPYVASSEEEIAAAHDLERSLDLWRDGKLHELYERTIPKKGEGRESFARTLGGSYRKPACCWEKLQETKVTLKDDRQAIVHARFGIEEPGAGTEFVTRSVKMVKEDGIWKVAMADILKLAAGKKGKLKKGKAKKASHHRKSTIVTVVAH